RGQGGDLSRDRPQAVGSRALQDRGRGGRRPLHRLHRRADDLLGRRLRHQRCPSRRRAGALPLLTARGTLAIHPGALGDVLLAVPALRALRARGPVTLAAQPRLAALLRALDVVDAAVAFDGLALDALFVDAAARTPRLPPAARVVSW